MSRSTKTVLRRQWLNYFLSPCFVCVFSALFISGCASHKVADAAKTETQTQPNTMTVSSSHGTFEIEPTVVSYDPQTFNDPLESINRPIFAFNDFMFRYLLIPASEGYEYIMPKPLRTGVSHFFSNIREPLNAVNHIFQGEGTKTGSNISRFLINTTIGIFGLFDPAEAWFDIKPQKATFNQTLASYDVGYGTFLVLPFLGQTDTRNGVSTVVEGLASPLNLVTDSPQTFYIQAYGSFHEFAPDAKNYEKLKQQSDDPYVFFRNLYLQGVLRDQQFSEGGMPSESFPLNPHSTGHSGETSEKATVNKPQAEQ